MFTLLGISKMHFKPCLFSADLVFSEFELSFKASCKHDQVSSSITTTKTVV